MSWQPIDTCPNDTDVIVWDDYSKQCVVAQRSKISGCFFVADSYGFNEDGEIPSKDVTAWMPVPAGPGV